MLVIPACVRVQLSVSETFRVPPLYFGTSRLRQDPESHVVAGILLHSPMPRPPFQTCEINKEQRTARISLCNNRTNITMWCHWRHPPHHERGYINSQSDGLPFYQLSFIHQPSSMEPNLLHSNAGNKTLRSSGMNSSQASVLSDDVSTTTTTGGESPTVDSLRHPTDPHRNSQGKLAFIAPQDVLSLKWCSLFL